MVVVAYQVLEVDEGKAPAAAGVAVEDHLDLLERPELLELGLELPLVGVEAQTEHAEALAWRGVISVALVSPPDRNTITTIEAFEMQRNFNEVFLICRSF